MPRLLARAADWCEANGQPETAIGYAQQAGTSTGWRGWSSCALTRSTRAAASRPPSAGSTGWRQHGALERNAAVAVLGALLAAVWGRPAEAERRADAAERASYDGSLPDGSASIDSWLALLRALRCQQRGGEDARRRGACRPDARPREPVPAERPLLMAISQWLAGEIDQADDLFADVAEEGLELGASEAVAVALGERAAIAIGREAWVQAEELADRALRVIRHARMEEYPTSAFVYAVAARVALHRGEAERAQEFLARAQRLRPRLTYALPYLSVQTRLELARAYLTIADAGGAETMLREIEALLRRQPDLGTLPAEVQELRTQPEDDARRRPRRLDPDRGGTAHAPLPRHAPLLPRDR